MTEAVYNFTTWNASGMVVRLAHPDIASSEYSSNAPFHNVTILLPIVISVLVLVAVLGTLFAFMRKEDVLHDSRECRSNSAQNLRLRPSSVRSKEDTNEMMLSFPMTDYHSLCTNTTSLGGKLCEVASSLNGISGPNHQQQYVAGEAIYGPYSSPKRSMLCENGNELQSAMSRPATRVTVNSHHIYAEPNGTLQAYAQPRCMLAPSSADGCLLETSEGTGLPSAETFRALITSNAHI